MSLSSIGRWLRVIALVSLFIALFDAAKILGVGIGTQSPMAHYGILPFVVVATITMTRLFAAVGLWIEASWGAVLLVGATVAEVALLFVVPVGLRPSLPDLGLRLVLAIGLAAIFGVRFWHARENVHE